MKLSKLTLAMATALGASVSYSALAIDLYVDTKTKQIFAEPGKHRVKMGSFEQVKQGSTESTEDKASLDAIRQDLELKENAIKALEEHVNEKVKDAAEVKLGEKGIEFESKDGNFKMAINGRMQVDSQINANNNPANSTAANNGGTAANNITNKFGDGVSLRRARLGVEGTFFKDFDYKFEYDFTRGNGTVAAGITDAFITWNISKPFSLKVGQFKEPFSMEEATSNRYLTFIERNQAVNSFSDNPNSYKMGLGVNYVEDQYGIMAAFMTETIGSGWANSANSNTLNVGTTTAPAATVGFNGGTGGNRSTGLGNTSWDATARAFGRPWMEDKEHFLHVGASGSYRSVNNNYQAGGALNNGGMTFTSFLNNNVDRTSVLNTGNLSATGGTRIVDHFTRFGADAAVVYGPFSAQAEYIRTDISGNGYKNTALDGYYGYMSYFLTGESRNYKSKTGAWDRIKPARNFDMKGGWGAWELATGYDYLDLNSGTAIAGTNVNGGRASTAKVALNWYLNSHVRFMANYVHVLSLNTSNMSAGGRSNAFNGTNPDMFETRVQVDW